MAEPLLTDFDLHLLAEGTHYRTDEKLGAYLREVIMATYRKSGVEPLLWPRLAASWPGATFTATLSRRPSPRVTVSWCI